jgi:hypothetical protein
MGITKTLGGDRLGSGSKQKVQLHNYERSTHDLGYLWRSTMSAGTLVPFLSEVALPGDTFDINLQCDIKTHPTIGPLFGSYKVQLDVFQAPFRLYHALLHNNKLGVGLNMSQIKLPQIGFIAYKPGTEPEDIDNSQINPSSLMAYLGVRGIGRIDAGGTSRIRYFNAIPVLAYWEIYKNYYANKQEEIGAVIHTPTPDFAQTVTAVDLTIGGNIPQTTSAGGVQVAAGDTLDISYLGATPTPSSIIFNTSAGPLSAEALFANNNWTDTGTHLTNLVSPDYEGLYINFWDYTDPFTPKQTAPKVVTFELSHIDSMRDNILAKSTPNVPFIINTDVPTLEPYKWLYESNINLIPNILSSQEGLGIKTYQSDLFNNWLQTEWIDGATGINAITAIDTSGGSFTIDTLNLSKKVYDMLNRIAVSGGSYDDWLDAVYAHESYRRCESPMYMGGLIKELVFQEVVSNSQTTDQPLGTLAGKGIMAHKHKGGNVVIKVDEPSYIIGIISLTPRCD